MADNDEHILKKALPPATDYLTYLTILEYNLTKVDLPLLHEILQDEKLVVNIGWDLVHLLLPLLPESRECIEDVAIRGNPREVILKVTEALDHLALPEASEEDDSEDDSGDDTPLKRSQQQARNAQSFGNLLRMLCILHSRIQTKKPSRFLETSVSAIVSACGRIASSENATRSSLMFLRTMSGSTRPALPPRDGEVPIPTIPDYSAPTDPEADSNPKADGEEEAKMRLLRILVSHVIDSYLDSVGERDPASPIHWTERFMLHTHPELLTSSRAERTKALETGDLSAHETLIRQILDLSMVELKMDWVLLLGVVCEEEEFAAEDDQEEEKVTMSKRGALYLMAELKSRPISSSLAHSKYSLTFKDHDQIATVVLGDPQVSLDTNVPPATADALIRLGWSVADGDGFDFDPKSEKDDSFNMYLQKFSALAVTQASSGLRYHAYLFTDHVLKSHPSSRARLSFLRDTYSFCPFTSLKEVAVIWVKDEYVQVAGLLGQNGDESNNVFALSSTLRQIISDLTSVDEADLSLDMLSAEGRFFQELTVSKYISWIEGAISKAASIGAEDADTTELDVLQLSVGMAREGLKLVNSA